MGKCSKNNSQISFEIPEFMKKLWDSDRHSRFVIIILRLCSNKICLKIHVGAGFMLWTTQEVENFQHFPLNFVHNIIPYVTPFIRLKRNISVV